MTSGSAPGASVTGLVGSTGFVGGTIARQRPIDRGYHRPDVTEIRGQRFDRLYLAGAPAQKWVANADPAADLEALEVLVGHLREVEAAQVVLISTVDVYPAPHGVDEATPVAQEHHPEAYGRNRLWLELAVRELFPTALVLRLPGLFGVGLRKNLIFDLLHEREEFAHRDAEYQFYDMSRLCDDVDSAVAAGLYLLNLATEPVAAHVVGREVFGRELVRTEGTPASYDMRTRHADLLGGAAGTPYLNSREEVLDAIRAFVAGERATA